MSKANSVNYGEKSRRTQMISYSDSSDLGVEKEVLDTVFGGLLMSGSWVLLITIKLCCTCRTSSLLVVFEDSNSILESRRKTLAPGQGFLTQR